MADGFIGGNAVLVFALPQSPMAQPWIVIAGNTLSTLIGISCFYMIGEPLLAACGCSIVDFGYVYVALPTSTSCGGSHNCSFRRN